MPPPSGFTVSGRLVPSRDGWRATPGCVGLRSSHRPVINPLVQLRYNPRLRELARELRKHSTLGEILLWNQLKRGQLLGIDFHRQKPLDEYIVDFFAPELLLAIELDGGSHRLKGDKDIERQRRLESLGIRFLRFEEATVRQHIDYVVHAIENWIRENRPTHTPRPSGTPLKRGLRRRVF
jgi:very-short-patch-repair endonuclease